MGAVFLLTLISVTGQRKNSQRAFATKESLALMGIIH